MGNEGNVELTNERTSSANITEEAAAEELGDFLGGVPGCFVRFGEFGEVAGDFGGDLGGFASGVERQGIGPDEPESLADFLPGKVGKADARMEGVRKGEVGFAGLGEISVKLEGVTHINNEEERRVLLGFRKRKDLAFGLAFGADHGVVIAVGATGCVFRAKSDSDSNLIRTLIPIQFGQAIRFKPDSDSDLISDTFLVARNRVSSRLKLFTRRTGATLDKSAA